MPDPWDEYAAAESATAVAHRETEVPEQAPWLYYQQTQAQKPWEDYATTEPARPDSALPDWYQQPARSSEELAAQTFYDTKNLLGGRLPEAPSGLNNPHQLVTLAHGLTPNELAQGWDVAKAIFSPGGLDTSEDVWQRLSEPVRPSKTQKVVAGVDQAVAGAVNFLGTDLGVLTLGTGALPRAAQKLVAAAWVTKMFTDLPDQVQELAEGYFAKDPEQIARGAAGLGLNTAFITGGLLHGMKGEPTVPAPPVEPSTQQPSEFGGLETINPKSSTLNPPNAPPEIQIPQSVPVEPARPALQRPAAEASPGNRLPSARGEAPAETQAPLTVTEAKYLAEDLRARKPPAELVQRSGFALPEGYALEGDRYVYTEPAPVETDAQRLNREAREAMAALREQKTSEPDLAQPDLTQPDLTQPDLTQPELPQPETAPPTEPPNLKSPIAAGERPYDLLDWISDSYPRGIRPTLRPDFDEAVTQYKAAAAGKLKSLLGQTTGERADQVLEQMHAEGMFRRITTEDELYAAMARAAQARKAFTQRQPDLLRRLDALKLDTGSQLHAFGLIPAAWNALVDAVKLGVRAGQAFNDAVTAAIAKVKELFPDHPPFDEAGLREHFRQYGAKVLVSDKLRPEVTAGVSEYTYTPRPQQTDLQTANRIIAERGLDDAILAYKDLRNDMPGAVRSILGDRLTEQLASAQRLAEASGDVARSNSLIVREIDLIDYELQRSTDVAQNLAAMRRYGLMSPTAIVRHAKRTLDTNSKAGADTFAPAVDQTGHALDEGRRTAVDQLRTDPATGDAARAAVDSQVQIDPEVHRAVVMELAGPWSQSPAILNRAREAVRAKANELLNVSPRPPGLTAPQHLRQILDDLAQRAASIAANHYQGADPSTTLTQKLQQRLGLTEQKAAQLAKGLDAEFARQVKAAGEQIPKRIAAARIANAQGLPENASDSAVDRAIRKRLRDLNLKLGDLLQQHSSTVDVTRREIGDRIVADSGLTGPAADTLRATINRRWEELATNAQRQALKQLVKTVPDLPKEVRQQWEKLIRLSNLGGLSREDIFNALKDKLNLPTWSPELAAEITRRANQLQTKPAGFQREHAVQDLLNFIERQKGVRWQDLPMAFWYANILSGLSTHAKNMLSTGLNLAANIAITTSRHPAAFPEIVTSLARGLGKGIGEAQDVLQTGMLSGSRLAGKLAAGRPLELAQFTGWAYPLNAWKYILRGMAAEDLLFFKPAEEMHAALAARMLAKREGLSGDALSRRVDEILGRLPERIAQAHAQATNEGFERSRRLWRGLDHRRRVAEILEQQRPQNLNETAKDYALQVTFNGEPSGVLGAIARGLNYMSRDVPALRFVTPFTNIVANVANESLNYLPPVGFTRALWGTWKGRLEGKPIADREQLYDQYAKAVLSTAALTAVATAAAQYLDDPDPKFAIYGAGPRTPDQKKQWRETGATPWTFKIGPHYGNYAYTPAALPLAILGSYMDALRWKHLDETDALNRVAYALSVSGQVITEQSFLSGIRDLLRSLDAEQTKSAGQTATKAAARTASSFVVPNLLKQVDQIFDPTVYDATDVQSILVSQVPFARRLNKPAINVLGEPVTRYLSDQFLSTQRPDPLWQTLAEKQAWVPVPDRDVIVGDKKAGLYAFRIMTPDERYNYIQDSGRQIRYALGADLYLLKSLPPADAQAHVHRITEAERAKAKAKFGL